MFQFRRFPSYTYLIQYMMLDLYSSGLLHSDICGSIRACQSPQLFAAYHVLRRLPMPRHSPCALLSLTILNYACFSFEEFCSIFYLANLLSFSFAHLILFFLIAFTFALFSFQGSNLIASRLATSLTSMTAVIDLLRKPLNIVVCCKH